MDRFLAKAIQVQGLNTIDSQLESNTVVPFKNDGQHHYSIKDIKPELQMQALFDKEIIISLSDSDHDVIQTQNSFLSIVLTANLQFDNKFEQFDDSYKDGVILFVGLKSGSNIIREYTVYHRERTINESLQNDAAIESFIYNTIKPKEIEEAIGQQTKVPYLMPVRFKIQEPLDDLLIFSAIKDYPNGMFGDLKIKFKINPNAFVIAQVHPTVSLAKYYTMNKDELLSSGQQKLMDIDLFFRNWSLTFQNTKQFTQLGCAADLIISIRTEQLTPNGLNNLVCDISPVTVSIKNYEVTEVTANMAGYKATDACLARVRDFFSTKAFIVPAQRVETWPFPISATLTRIRTSQNIPLSHVTDFVLLFPKDTKCITCFENPCYQNMQLMTCGRSFPDMPMNTIDQQFFQLQRNVNNLDLLFEATDEFENALTTPGNTATRRLNAHTDLTSFMISLQCKRNSNGTLTFDGLDTMNQNISIELFGALIYQGVTDNYQNVDINGKRPPPPILCTVHDTFWLFSPNHGGSCYYDTTHSFNEVVNEIGA
ncbi:MAG: hypothetical protein EZS28_002839 [Streblomastix strix]|uniref:Uncharacterized protein n=1 Tax=Streblomastix strix TaxID=222440 RepID=A0A5J4X4G9_9EUKA|nr:MAG: hypothetical protein EZS28_002839 [Streblomastix strix]